MKFLWPGAFWFAATIPVVVVFYLLKRKRVVKLVSSTLLWQKFLADAQANSPFQKLRHNWLLVLQLLLLTLAILALSRPYFSGHTRASDLRVVILDASASMQSTDEEPSRFEKARTDALALVNSLKDEDQMLVLLAGGNTEVKQSATSSKASLRRAIQDCQVSDSPTRLTEALEIGRNAVAGQTRPGNSPVQRRRGGGLERVRQQELERDLPRVGKAVPQPGHHHAGHPGESGEPGGTRHLHQRGQLLHKRGADRPGASV